MNHTATVITWFWLIIALVCSISNAGSLFVVGAVILSGIWSAADWLYRRLTP